MGCTARVGLNTIGSIALPKFFHKGKWKNVTFTLVVYAHKNIRNILREFARARERSRVRKRGRERERSRERECARERTTNIYVILKSLTGLKLTE